MKKLLCGALFAVLLLSIMLPAFSAAEEGTMIYLNDFSSADALTGLETQ